MTTTPTVSDPQDTTAAELEQVLDAAAAAADPLREQEPRVRAAQLHAVADRLDAAAGELVPLAEQESRLSTARLTGELARTTYQIRFLADHVADGSYLQATLDRADPEFVLGPKPDLRRVLVPVGPVLVFAASNFPFAFAVPGGDTASALAAGCPVVVKGHPGHPRLSARLGELISEALDASGAPSGTFAVVLGMEAGTTALRDERITASAFTGSIPGGRALFDIASSRPSPIPFFGELGSLNPVFVTPAAAAARPEALVSGYVTSYSANGGQLCTKPGLIFLPAGHGLREALAERSHAVERQRLLNGNLHEGYCARRESVSTVPGLEPLVPGDVASDADGVLPTLLTTDVETLLANRDRVLEEVFGPFSIVVEYASTQEAWRAAEAFEGNLTAGVHAEGEDDDELVGGLVERLRARAGRVLFNGWPTGVAVSPAMQHGGPYPATTDARFTSVGTASVDRFLRPVTYQDTPDRYLPAALREDNPWGVARRVHEPQR